MYHPHPHRDRLERGHRSLSSLRWSGSGTLAPIVLAHPVNTQAAVWTPLAELLVEAGASVVIAVDYRCHGASDVFGPLGAAAYAEDLADVLDAHGITAAHVVGGSIGGAVGVELIAQGRIEVLSLALVAAGLRLRMPTSMLADALAEVQRMGPDAWFRAHGAGILGERARPGVADELVVLAGGRDGGLVADIIDSTFRLEDATATALSLAGRMPPSLIVVGEQDPTCPPEMANDIAPLFQTVPVVLTGIGHLPSLEAPDLVAAELVPFLSALPSSDPTPSLRRSPP